MESSGVLTASSAVSPSLEGRSGEGEKRGEDGDEEEEEEEEDEDEGGGFEEEVVVAEGRCGSARLFGMEEEV